MTRNKKNKKSPTEKGLNKKSLSNKGLNKKQTNLHIKCNHLSSVSPPY